MAVFLLKVVHSLPQYIYCTKFIDAMYQGCTVYDDDVLGQMSYFSDRHEIDIFQCAYVNPTCSRGRHSRGTLCCFGLRLDPADPCSEKRKQCPNFTVTALLHKPLLWDGHVWHFDILWHLYLVKIKSQRRPHFIFLNRIQLMNQKSRSPLKNGLFYLKETTW